jgi:thaumarchaeosortase
LFLDYYNVEKFPSPGLGHIFDFELTWKGRMFYMFFLWVLFLESILDWEGVIAKKPSKPHMMILSILFAIVPTFYVVSFNFLDIVNIVLKLDKALGITAGSFIIEHWSLAAEYLLFTLFFLISVALAYGKSGLRFFSISSSIIGGMGIFYMIDTLYPGGVFTPLQSLALPTAACATALLYSLGYKTTLNFYWFDQVPRLTIDRTVDIRVSADIAWPCAGVHSMFLFVVIILLFFKRSNISSLRKTIYFFVGAIGTFAVNVSRIVAYFLVNMEYGQSTALFFHDSYGELFFLSWMGIFLSMIFCIERFRVVEKLRDAKNRLAVKLHSKIDLIRKMISPKG